LATPRDGVRAATADKASTPGDDDRGAPQGRYLANTRLSAEA
jgi:hypothetical protein